MKLEQHIDDMLGMIWQKIGPVLCKARENTVELGGRGTTKVDFVDNPRH